MSVESMTAPIGSSIAVNAAPRISTPVMGTEARGMSAAQSFSPIGTEPHSDFSKPQTPDFAFNDVPFNISGNQLNDLEGVLEQMSPTPELAMDVSSRDIETLEQILEIVKTDPEIPEPIVELSETSRPYLETYTVGDLSGPEMEELKADTEIIQNLEGILTESGLPNQDVKAFGQSKFEEMVNRKPYGAKLEKIDPLSLREDNAEAIPQTDEDALADDRVIVVEDEEIPEDVIEQATEDKEEVVVEKEDGTEEKWVLEEDPVAKAARQWEGYDAIGRVAQKVEDGEISEVYGADVEEKIHHTPAMTSEIAQDEGIETQAVDGSEMAFREEVAKEKKIPTADDAREIVDRANAKHIPVRFRRIQTQPAASEENVDEVIHPERASYKKAA